MHTSTGGSGELHFKASHWNVKCNHNPASGTPIMDPAPQNVLQQLSHLWGGHHIKIVLKCWWEISAFSALYFKDVIENFTPLEMANV